MNLRLFCFLARLVFICTIVVPSSHAADWPMWRYDAGRRAASPEQLPAEMNLLWVRQYSPRTPVWDDPLNHDLMPYDRIFEPVVADGLMFIGFNDSDKIVAIDTATGEERWTFYVDGPVRLPCATRNGKVFATSDDGYLYCLNARDGSLAWKFRGGPSDRRLLGNKRLISMWPARGGVVIEDGVVYFAASIWPFMGIFIYAIDADTGDVVWVNDGEGARFMSQPHNAPSFAGVAPQGSMVVSGDRLLISGGRSVPACFDRHTGKFLYYELASSGKTGGSFVAAVGDVFFNHYRERVTTMYHIGTGFTLVPAAGRYPVLTEGTWYFSGDVVTACRGDWVGERLKAWSTEGDVEAKDLAKLTGDAFANNRLWEIGVDASGDLIRAGDRLYAAGEGVISAIDLPANGGTPMISWSTSVEGKIERLLASDGRLFAVTLDGRIMAFGAGTAKPRLVLDRPVAAEHSPAMNRQARELLSEAGVSEGYALFYGVGDGALIEALIGNSDLHIIAVDPVPSNVERLRRRFDENGLYGSRVSVHVGDPFTFAAPPYFASLTVVEDPSLLQGRVKADLLDRLYMPMRPYGGVCLVTLSVKDRERLAALVRESELPGLTVRSNDGDRMIVVREGALPGAGTWTHNYGDIGNTAKSDDDRVRLPLGLLWFGGSSNMDVLPRHGHGPVEQVVGGRLFIEGVNCLNARDVYTGRPLWKTMLHDLDNYGVYYDKTYRDTPTSTSYNQVHLPGANIRGTNFVASTDAVYVLEGPICHALDPASGKKLRQYRLPATDPEVELPQYPEWAYIGLSGDVLIGGYGFVAFSDILNKKKADYSIWEDFDRSASSGLVAMNADTGEVIWKVDACYGFLHNGIAVGGGRIYCLDKYPPGVEDMLSRRGKTPPDATRLIALDLRTGEVVWEESGTVFGSFLSYSDEHDLLIQSTRPSRDMVRGEEGNRIAVFRGGDGSVVWDKPLDYQTFPILHGERIVTEGAFFSLMTGDLLTRANPITGREIPWSWKRNYGCNYPIASEHLLTFRSGAAGFYDFENAGGTGNFGGFKSGCTNTLVVADGVLNVPDYTRTCSCAYQNQTSLAMVHMPDADIEYWTFDTVVWDGAPVKRVGINFGAPGDRVADNGGLWIDFPSVGGESPDLPVTIVPDNPRMFRRHMSRVSGDELTWVAASGAESVERVRVTLAKEPTTTRRYTVKLVFVEPRDTSAGERVFDVVIQGKRVLKSFDIAKRGGGSLKTVIRTFKRVKADTEIVVDFIAAGSSKKKPVISGMEVIAE